MSECGKIFVSFFKIGLFTFGRRVCDDAFVQKRTHRAPRLHQRNELIDYYSVGQCLPGVIAINVATFTGYKVQGVSGAIAATLAVNLPSLVIIMALAGILNTLSENQIVSHAFAGIRIGVIALILNEVVLLFRKAVATQFQAVIFVAVLALLFWLHLSAVAVVLLAAGAGILKYRRSKC